MPHGIFRERKGGDTLVCMKYRDHNFLVPEEFYRDCGYSPPIEELPWREKREAEMSDRP